MQVGDKIYLIDEEKFNTHKNNSDIHVSLGETSSTAYRGDRGKTAYDHSQSTHARTDATKVEASSTNGNIKINGTETNVYTHPSGTNPHGTTKSDVGLSNVPNVATNDQTVTYTEASSLTKLSSGEKLSAAFGKVSKAITDLISHINDNIKHITSAERNNWNIAKTHADSTHARTDATKVEASTTNGNIKINGTETNVYTHPSGTNPHGTTKSDVGLSNVGNFKAVSTVANQGLTDTEKTNARANIGAAAINHTHTKSQISDFPTSLPASDVYPWAKSSTKPTYNGTELKVGGSGTYKDNTVENMISEINSNLDTLEYGEVAGGKNLFKGDFIGMVLDYINYTDIDLIKEQNPIKSIEGFTYVTFGAYLKKGTYTFSYTNNAYFSLNRIAIAGTNCIGVAVSIRKSYTWTQNIDGWTYFGIEGDDSETGITDTPFSITPNIQIEKGTQATEYEPYIPSVKMIAEENAQQSSDLDGLGYGENGAKNLFKGYDVMKSYTISSETYNGYPVIYSDQQWEGAYQSDLILKSGVTYTISAYLKGNGDAYLFSSLLTGYMKHMALTDNFERFSFVYTPKEDISQIRIENGTDGGLYIACFQIEEGDTATPYKPYIPSVKMLAEEVNAQNESLEAQGLDNKFDGILFQGFFDTNGTEGNPSTSDVYVVNKNPINVSYGDIVNVKYSGKEATMSFLQFYKSDGSNNGAVIMENGSNIDSTFVVPADSKTMHINIGNSDGISINDVSSLYVSVNNEITKLKNDLSDMKSNFQAGVDGIYNAIVAQGTTPSSKSQSDVKNAIGTLSTNRYNNGKTDYNPTGATLTNAGALTVTNAAGTSRLTKTFSNSYDAGVTATKKGTAGAAQVLTGYTFTNSSSVEASGSMPNQGAVSASLNCGGSYTIPAGYHNGSGIVTANSLASQTSATAAAGDIVSGKTAYVNGTMITGTITSVEGVTF